MISETNIQEFCELIKRKKKKREKRKLDKIEKQTNRITFLERVVDNIGSESFLFKLSADLLDLVFVKTDNKSKSEIEEPKKRFLRSLSIITKKQLIRIYKFRDALNKSIIKHLTKVFSKTTSAISSYVSILYSINNYTIFS